MSARQRLRGAIERGGVYVIAEAGVNHNGSLALARELVDAAADAGADAVKFQTFRAGELATAGASKAAYQERATDGEESQLEMLRRLELPQDAHHELLAQCRSRGIGFLSSPFDHGSLRFLIGELGLDVIKIPSGELTNGPLLFETARGGSDVIVSTGMATLAEVEEAVGVLAFGYTAVAGDSPSLSAFRRAWSSDAGKRAVRQSVILLHCTTEYPTAPADVNLRAMDSLRDTFGLPVGFSDHTAGIMAAVAAVGRGAVVIEKHFTLDRNQPGPDHAASLEPNELSDLVAGIRQVQVMLGSGSKVPVAVERPNAIVARKSLVAARPIAAGEALSMANLAVKRPGNGVSPMRFWQLVGTVASRAYSKDELIEE